MRKKQHLFLLCSLMLCLSLNFFALAASGDTIVYVTDTGEKYHVYGCGYLKSSNSITLQEAVDRGYTPCSRCSPPRLDKSETPDNNDRTTDSYSSYSPNTPPQSNNSYPEPKIVYETVYETMTEVKEVPFVPQYLYWIIAGLGGTIIILIIIACRSSANAAEERKYHKHHAANIEQLHKEDMSRAEEQFKKDLFILLKYIIGSYTAFPDGCIIGKDGLPAKPDSSWHKWGETYTFYLSKPAGNYQRYHSASCQHAKGRFPINAFSIVEEDVYTPCKVCNPKLPNTVWVYNYKRIKEIAEKYHFFVDTTEV